MTIQTDARALPNAAQVAERLGVNSRMVRRLTEQRRLPFVKVERLVRFRPADVERCLDEWRIDSVDRPAAPWVR